MWKSVTPGIAVLHSLDTIFSAIITGGIDTNNDAGLQLKAKKELITGVCRGRFISDFPFNIFNNVYAILYEIIVTLQVTNFSEGELRLIIDNNRDLILNSPYVNTSTYSKTATGNIASDDDIILAITGDLVDKYYTLSNNYVTEDEFKSAVNIYINWYKNAFGAYTANSMAAIMQDNGYDEQQPGKRARHYQGLADMQEFYNSNMRILKSLSDEDKIRSTVIDAKWLEEELQNENKTDTDSLFSLGIKEMDATIGQLRRGNIIGIMGPPKGGKTRFTNYVVQLALSKGLNVCVWPLEGTKAEWLSMQTAAYIARVSYEDTKSGKKDGMLRISSKDILQKKYLASPTMRKEIAAAKQNMAISEKYGRLSFIEGTAYVEDMFDVLLSHYDNDNHFDVLVVDQLVNVMSKKGKGKVERISEAYMEMKNFLANKLKRPALGLMPAQLKQDVVDYLRRNPDETIDVTAGGESAETVRTPDEVIGLFSSKEERDNNIMKIYSVASRHNGSFQDFQARCYLECCFFLSQDDDIN